MASSYAGEPLHRLLARLFGPDLWNASRRTVAGGLALGIFIGFTPDDGRVDDGGDRSRCCTASALDGGIPDSSARRRRRLRAKVDLQGYTGMLRSFAGYAKHHGAPVQSSAASRRRSPKGWSRCCVPTGRKAALQVKTAAVRAINPPARNAARGRVTPAAEKPDVVAGAGFEPVVARSLDAGFCRAFRL
jgi:hypothetical protein